MFLFKFVIKIIKIVFDMILYFIVAGLFITALLMALGILLLVVC